VLDVTEVQVNAFVDALEEGYRRSYGRQEPEHPGIIRWAGETVLELIAGSDALYHDLEHTMLVTLVGQEILRGKHAREGGVTPKDWLQVIVALLCHDIGYVKGVCRADRGLRCDRGDGTMVDLPEGSTDAALTPYHVDRGQRFVAERFAENPWIDVARVTETIEHTRFPVPAKEDPREVSGLASVVRSADLIGQLSDPRYLTKTPALYYEFVETGVAAQLGYRDPGDLRRNYPRFYWSCVFPCIKDGLFWLEATQRGREIRANLFANVFMAEHAAGEVARG